MGGQSADLVKAACALHALLGLRYGLRLAGLLALPIALAGDRVNLAAVTPVHELELATNVADGIDGRRLALVLRAASSHESEQPLCLHLQASFAAEIVPRIARQEPVERP